MLADPCVELWKLRREVRAALRQTQNVFSLVTLADALDPLMIPSVALHKKRDGELAEVDQDGFAFAVDPADAAFFNRRDRKLERNRHGLPIVIHGGRICVRKRFSPGPSDHSLRSRLRTRLYFYREAAALLRLRNLTSAPQVRAIDIPSLTIHRDYIDGDSLRHLAGAAGAVIHDLDLEKAEETRGLTEAELEEREIQLFARVCDEGLTRRIYESVLELNGRGVLLLDDVKLGNVVVGRKSGRCYWIDFEFTQLSGSRHWEESLRYQDLRLEKWFGRRLSWLDMKAAK
jgi:hypothetical protein